jgi:lipoate-protein ligase A
VLSVIVDNTRDPAHNLALDEALARAEAPAPLLRVWQNDPSVIIGRFQHAATAVDLAACARDGIQVLRRATGGGAVFTGPGSLNVTLVTPRPGTGPLAANSLDELMATAVEGFGRWSATRGGILRSAALCTRRRVLAHATLQVSPVVPYGRGYVSRRPVGADDERTRADRDRLGSGEDPGLMLDVDAVRAALYARAVERFGMVCTREPTAAELGWRDQLLDVRYGDITWHLSGRSRKRLVISG